MSVTRAPELLRAKKLAKAPTRRGWPKPLPCLGFCGQIRLSQHPGDRFCMSCRRRRDEIASAFCADGEP